MKKIAVCSDEPYPVNGVVVSELEKRGVCVVRFGSLKSQHSEPWAIVTQEAAQAIARGECDGGVFFCWTGTGSCMAANKVPGIRAALCTDAKTAQEARIWNHANVLVLSNRLISPDLAKEIVSAWLDTPCDTKGQEGVARLNALDRLYRKVLIV